MVLDFKVSDSAVEKLLPTGWKPDAAISGPSAGANLRLVLIDQMAAHNALGRPLTPVRNLVIYVPARATGAEARGLVTAVFFTSRAGGGTSPYGGDATAAEVAVERKVRHEPSGTTGVEESWDYRTKSGDTIALQVHYIRGTATREKVDARIYSAVKPGFFRIYRYEQGFDTVRGAGAGTERLRKLDFKISGERFAPLFDGTEQLIGITSVPWQQREVFLPGS